MPLDKPLPPGAIVTSPTGNGVVVLSRPTLI
jgi:hypothetical protein